MKNINSRYFILKKNSRVLDLGSYPGSWLQYCVELECEVIGIDIRDIDKVDGAKFHRIDMLTETNKIYKLGKFDVVLSDSAPKFSGIKEIDLQNAFDLNKKSFEIASNVLVNHGTFVCKIFQENEEKTFSLIKGKFENIRRFKPNAIKKGSSEMFFVCMGYKLKSIQTR